MKKDKKVIRPKKTIKGKNKPSTSKPIICWDCGETGHTRNQCRVRKKIRELHISDEIKESLFSLIDELDNSSDILNMKLWK